jgi:hypothetical protein
MTTQIKSVLNDDQIVEIGQKIDQLIFDIGDQYSPTGIEFAAIAFGRLMVFTKQVDCNDIFMDMIAEVLKMREPTPLVKTEDLQ